MWATDRKVQMLDKLQIDGFDKPLLKDKVKKQSIEGRVIVLCLSTWFFGYVLTEISLTPPIVWFNQFGIDMTQQNFVGPCFGLIPLGAALGTLFNYYAMNKFNRRIYLIIINILSLIFTGTLQLGGTISLFVFRIFQGIICGIWMSFIPTYIGQLTPRELGSKFGVYPQISVVLGVFVSLTVGMIMINCFDFESLPSGVPIESLIIPSWHAQTYWRVMFGIGLLPSMIQLICAITGYIPQSPHSLINKNRREEAVQVLSIFYEENYINNILVEKEKVVREDLNVTIDAMTIWRPKGYYIGFQLAIFQALTGIASYVTQTGHFVAVTLQQPIFGIYTPIVITIAQLIGTLISIPLLEYLEWRWMTIIGGLALSILNAFTGALLYLFDNTQSFQPYAMTLAAVSIVAFMFTFGITVGSSVWPYVGYMMPSGAILVAQVINWLLAGLSIIAFSFVINARNSPVIMMWVYAGVTFVFTILNWIFMIDIKGLSVVKVQQKLAQD